MKRIALLLLFLSTCYGQVDFSERPRNCSIDLLQYTQLEAGGHLVISPFGIWSLMTGVALGASGNGYSQLIKAFILPDDQQAVTNGYKDLNRAVLRTNNEVSLTSNNFIFLDKGFSIEPAFRDTIQNDFGASLQVLDFGHPNAVEIANRLVEESGGKVKNVLRSDDFRKSTMILLNVISFKGLWKLPFNETDTLVEPFYDENQMEIGKVNMMFQKGEFPFSNIEPLNSFVAELPYGTDEKYSMLIILPNPKVKVTDVLKNFADVSMTDIFKRLKDDAEEYGVGDVDVKLPRFHINTNLLLNKPLNDMGVKDIFRPDLANFQRITADSIFVSSIVHTADIEVTESGTVATAATTATFSDRISAPNFYANRPFIYFIMEKSTTTVLFSGIYSKPTVY